MKLFVKFNIDTICRIVLQEQLDILNVAYTITGPGTVQFALPVPSDQYNLLVTRLNKYGIDIIDNQKAILVQKIKDAILSMLMYSENLPLLKISSYLSDKLNENYRTLSNVFSEICHISIESYVIIHKIELVKNLLVVENMSLTEISYKLHYSSVAHLSSQFKKITGLTPTTFQKIVLQKKNTHLQS